MLEEGVLEYSGWVGGRADRWKRIAVAFTRGISAACTAAPPRRPRVAAASQPRRSRGGGHSAQVLVESFEAGESVAAFLSRTGGARHDKVHGTGPACPALARQGEVH